MTRIGRNPGLRRLPLIVVVSAVGALILGWRIADAVEEPDAFFPIAVGSFVGLVLLVFCLVVFPYRTLSWDERAGTATFGRRTVALSSITRAVRTLSVGGNGASVTYRFFSTEGPSVRVLVAGRPTNGLDPEGLAELRRFVAASAIAEPPRAEGLSDEQSAAVDAFSDTGGKSSVGKTFLLAELDSAIAPGTSTTAGVEDTSDPYAPSAAVLRDKPAPARDPLAPPLPGEPEAGMARPRLSTEEARELELSWQRDDEDAVAFLARHPVPAATARRAFFWLTVLAMVAGAVTIVVAVVLEQAGGSLDSDTNDLVALSLGIAAVVGVLSYFAWCVSADRQVRRLQELSLSWNAARDPAQQVRGLAAPLLPAWAEPAPGTRLVRALSYVGSSIGGLAVLVGIILIVTDDEVGAAFSFGTAGVGAVVVALSVVGFVSSGRARRESKRRLVLLAGWRLFPPDVEDDGEA